VDTSLPHPPGPPPGSTPFTRSPGSSGEAPLTGSAPRVPLPGRRPQAGGERGGAARGSVPAARLVAPGRRQRVPHLLLGVVLILVCAAAGFLLSTRSSGRLPVLALARDVSAGTTLTAADLRIVQVAAGGDVATVPADQAASLVGATVAVPRPAGALLSPPDVGASRFPPKGKAVAAVALKAGQFPPGLSEGVKVAALIPADPQSVGNASSSASAGKSAGSDGSGSGAARSSWLPGVVIGVEPDVSGGSGVTVVSLLMDENAASAVGTAAAGSAGVASGGGLSLVVLAPSSDVEGG
jgi:SAF domain-containing protein